MTHVRSSSYFLMAVAALAVVLSACAQPSSPSRFYVLSTTEAVDGQRGAFKPARERSIGIGPVSMPTYLDKPQIVTNATRYQLDLAEFDQWAEPLGGNVTRVLVDNVSILMDSDRIHEFPANTAVRDDYQVAVDIVRYDCQVGGQCKLVARWSVFDLRRNKQISAKRSEYEKTPTQFGFEGLAQAMSEALADLSRDIAKRIQKF
ncbi:MAG: PqiC family protein [Alphaproteobacteria bacterium]|nr:PqiC family protein [Alphaproteobacteria bacterium]